ncbi:MAG: EpsG family protein [Prevotella sp.]|nr:EpsG family protein [Prevotella sp.]
MYSGLRYRVGTDSFMYMELFHYFPVLTELKLSTLNTYSVEPLWIILNSLVKTVYDDFILLQCVCALIINLAIFKFVLKHTKYKFLAITIYFLCDYFLLNFEFMRQSTALGLYYLFVHEYTYKKKNLLLWIIGTLILANMHNTIYICLLIPIFQRIKVTKKIIILTVFICFLLISSNDIFDYLSLIVPSYSAKMKIFAYQSRDVAYNFTFFLIKFYSSFLALFCIIYNKESPYRGVILLLFIIAALTVTNDIFDRLHYEISVFYYIVYAETIVKLIRNTSKKILPVALFFISFTTITYMLHNYKGTKYYVYHKFFPYYSCFDPKRCPEREALNRGEDNFNFIIK